MLVPLLAILSTSTSALASNHLQSIPSLHAFSQRSTISPLNLNISIPTRWSRWGDGGSGWQIPSKDNAWIAVDKVRGVNLGSLFIMEPWMARDSWNGMGCQGYDSEWECNEARGMGEMQERWENHWATFYQEEDFNEMQRLGLNTVRIPLGYWIVDSLIGSDPFASGSMTYLKRVLRWSRDAGLFAILDLHGAPGSQTTHQSFTGHTVDKAGFFSDENYEKAYDCLRNLTEMAHTDDDFSNVVMMQVLNEPLQGAPSDLVSKFYPGAQKAIRDVELDLGVNCLGVFPGCLTIQFMDTNWGSGDPTEHLHLKDWDHLAYDDHSYAQWMVHGENRTREGYLEYVCTNTRPTDMSGPVITGEWSISTMGGGELDPSSDGADKFFREFAAAAMISAEKGAGWVFWSWKTELGDSSEPLWGYYDAVQAGYIPKDLSTLDRTVCDRFGREKQGSDEWSHSARKKTKGSH
ncbi:hypothetical protein JCM10212_001710 [Sporobolomyces blumeae]